MKRMMLLMALCGSVMSFDGGYAGLGVGYSNLSNTYKDTDPNEIQFDKQKVSRLFGTGVLGYGTNICGVYTGLEAFADVGENKHQSVVYADGNTRGVSSKNAGDYLGLLVRVGKAFDKNLVYISGGTSYAKHDLICDDCKFKTRKFLPVIGIGYERMLGDRFSFRVDLSKKLSMKKYFDVIETKTNYGPSLKTMIVYNCK